MKTMGVEKSEFFSALHKKRLDEQCLTMYIVYIKNEKRRKQNGSDYRKTNIMCIAIP